MSFFGAGNAVFLTTERTKSRWFIGNGNFKTQAFFIWVSLKRKIIRKFIKKFFPHNVSSATIFEGVTCSLRAEMCWLASVMYLFRLRNPGVVGNMAYQSSLSVIVLSSLVSAFRNVTSNVDKIT